MQSLSSIGKLSLLSLMGLTVFRSAFSAESPTWLLTSSRQVDSSGIFLDQVVSTQPPVPLPALLLAPAPPLGQSVVLSRAEITEQVRRQAPEILPANCAGRAQVRVNRQSRLLGELEILELLVQQLRQVYVKEGDDLEFRLTRPWKPIRIPDEPIQLQIYNMPDKGISTHFVFHFDILTEREKVGSWQTVAQAKLWRSVLVANSPLRRGQPLKQADVRLERWDVLRLREPLDPSELSKPSLELTQNIPVGKPLLSRSVRLRPLVRRGQVVKALLHNGLFSISCKVQVLENGLFGETIRVRNLRSKREFYGKVYDERTITVSL